MISFPHTEVALFRLCSLLLGGYGGRVAQLRSQGALRTATTQGCTRYARFPWAITFRPDGAPEPTSAAAMAGEKATADHQSNETFARLPGLLLF